MTLYRIYVLDGHERISETLEARFKTDLAALNHAETARAEQYAAEVWDGERLVGRIGAEFEIQA